MVMSLVKKYTCGIHTVVWSEDGTSEGISDGPTVGIGRAADSETTVEQMEETSSSICRNPTNGAGVVSHVYSVT